MSGVSVSSPWHIWWRDESWNLCSYLLWTWQMCLKFDIQWLHNHAEMKWGSLIHISHKHFTRSSNVPKCSSEIMGLVVSLAASSDCGFPACFWDWSSKFSSFSLVQFDFGPSPIFGLKIGPENVPLFSSDSIWNEEHFDTKIISQAPLDKKLAIFGALYLRAALLIGPKNMHPKNWTRVHFSVQIGGPKGGFMFL